MEVGVFAIVPDLVSPEKSSAIRFGAIHTVRAFQVTEQTSAIRPFAPFVQEEGLPVGSHNPAGSVRSASARVRNSSVGGVFEGVVPCGGTRSEVSARRAGALEAIRVSWPLSTERPVQAAEVITSRSAVPSSRFAPQGGVRFGRYTTAMTACTALSAPAPLYVRASSVTFVGGIR